MARYKEKHPIEYKIAHEKDNLFYPMILCEKTTGFLWWKKTVDVWDYCAKNGRSYNSGAYGYIWSHSSVGLAKEQVDKWIEGTKDVYIKKQ